METAMKDELVEKIARAIDAASEETSLAFRDVHPRAGAFVANCRDEDTEKRLRQARSCLSAIESAGLVIVPREPTKEMVKAVERAPLEPPYVPDMWRAMLAAAPK